MKFLRTLLVLGALGVGLVSSANAASLYGKVVEVSEGDTLSIFNMNRSVRVRLLGIDAPELKQRFGDVSRQHLADLVFDKFVTVEYSGISSGSLVGKVMLDKTDICAQMVRDGAAWFDGKQRHVGELEAEVYEQSESAARQEKRGLWQDDAPIAPWEFARAEIERRRPVVATSELRQNPLPKKTANGDGLTTESVMFAGLPARKLRTPMLEAATDIIWANDSPDETWKMMRAAGEQLSAFVRSDGILDVAEVPYRDANVVSHLYAAKDDQGFYQLAWVSLPNSWETDEDIITTSFISLMNNLTMDLEKYVGPTGFKCTERKSTVVSMGGFYGREFDLSSCTAPGLFRVFTRLEGNTRRLYAALGLHRPGADTDAARDFVRSLKVGTAAQIATPKKK